MPDLQSLPGPAPASSKTYDLYIVLVKRCIATAPSDRPSFQEVVQKLREIAEEETKIVPRRPELSLTCVVCMEKAPEAGLVHLQDKM